MAFYEIDLEALLQPVEEDAPAGPDMRLDPADTIYFTIKDARADARSGERDATRLVGGEAEEAAQMARQAWQVIADKSIGLLAGKSKDLEVAAWLSEALLRFDGVGGLRAGIALMRGLVERFWDDGLYPQEDDDGIETRIAPLVSLNGEDGPGTLILPLKLAPLTSGDPGPFSYWQYEQASELNKIGDETRRNARIEAGAVTLEQFEQSLLRTPADELRQTYRDVSACITEYEALAALMRTKAGDDAPPSSTIVGLLRDMERCLKNYAGSLGEDAPATEAKEGGMSENGAAPRAAAGAAGPLASREDALRQLLKIAEFFERTEPHSVIPLTLRETVRRSSLPLSELLGELIPDEDARRSFFIRAGVRAPAED